MTISRSPSDLAASPPVRAAGDAQPWHGLALPTARRFHQRCLSETADMAAEAGLTTLQFGALLYISKQAVSNEVEQNKLATGMDVDRNSASLLVEQLVKRGLIERRVNGVDRRARLLNLTPKGTKLLKRLEPAFHAANDRILAPLSSRERASLFDLLNRVIEKTGTTARAINQQRRG